ncbi:MAG: AAA family ATPase [Polyangiaceae bacterium]|nr:AAA family ATPase [Polyangiaceae bacterium]
MRHGSLVVENLAQLRRVDVRFGDLTVLVGPQATGKSLILELLKLAVDAPRIAGILRDKGFGWRDRRDFCAVYFGEGMSDAWTSQTRVQFEGRLVSCPPRRISRGDTARLFYIPAHRALSVAEGWPAGFRSYKPDTPFVARDFSEKLLELLTTQRGADQDVVFPQDRRIKQQFRELIDGSVFHGGKLKLLSDGARRQFKLVYPGAEGSGIAYMAWTAGQREFIPLLLGIYHLVPLGRSRKPEHLDWVVIEEPEMGLHANAVQAVILLVLELMGRGYRVAISTHSSTVLEIVWALQVLQERRAPPSTVWKLFGVEAKRWDVLGLAGKVLDKSYRVFHLDYDGDGVISRDISGLSPDSPAAAERTWGDLASLSERVNEVVAEAMGGANRARRAGAASGHPAKRCAAASSCGPMSKTGSARSRNSTRSWSHRPGGFVAA